MCGAGGGSGGGVAHGINGMDVLVVQASRKAKLQPGTAQHRPLSMLLSMMAVFCYQGQK